MILMLTKRFSALVFVSLIPIQSSLAASGPIAEGFGSETWLSKLHVVGGVLALVLLFTATLLFLILRSEDPSRETNDE